MRILALDPGETTGFAWLHFDPQDANRTVRASGWGEIPVLASGVDGLVGSIDSWLDDFADHAVPTEIAFEGALQAYSVRSKVELHEARATIRAWAIRNQVPHYSYHPTTVKATATGHGNANKTAVAIAMRKYFDVPRFPSDHASDAVAIGVTHLVKEHGLDLGGLHVSLAETFQAQSSRAGTSRGSRKGKLSQRRA